LSTRKPTMLMCAVSLSLSALAFAAGGSPVYGQADSTSVLPLAEYQLEFEYLPTTPSVTGGAAGAFGNPAAWATGDRTETAFWWDDRRVGSGGLENWGFSHGHTLGMAFNRRTVGLGPSRYHIDDFQLGVALGDRRGHLGLAYRWSRSELDAIPREDAFVMGVIGRPNRWYSLGLSGVFSTESSARLGVGDIGIRPLGREWLTLFGDYTISEKETFADGSWGAGVAIRPLPGLQLGVKIRDFEGGIKRDYRYTFHVGVTLSGLGFHALPAYSEMDEIQTTSYLITHNASYRSVPVEPGLLRRAPRYVPVNLENKQLTYQSYRWFETKRVAWLDLVRRLDAIRDDNLADGVCLNLAGFRTRPSLAWELRQKLAELQKAGNLITYYIASVADRLTLDPQGDIMLPGLAVKRTYLKGTLEKLGLGFQELRYFTYKSAAETFSRDSMSDADREQIGRLVDVIYESVRQNVCQGRKLTAAQFDAIVEDDAILTAAQAKERGLIDGVARWDAMGKWLDEDRDGGRLWAMPADRGQRIYTEEMWGQPAKIAVVYGIGECAMDSGIKGRATSAYMRGLVKDSSVAAVVFRADSPGGDGLPSDLVAEAMTQLKEAGKPVIVTQGDVAGSGGYWISMNGTRILTTPTTVTGSIGVIAGWIWDDGIGEKTGLSADGVQRGRHADLFRGIRFPFLNMSLPQRPLAADELDRIKTLILELYDEFVGKVAKGRHLDESRVRQLAEGRIWMGGDAIENGLVDQYGSMTDAIALARKLADIPRGEEVELVEFPPRPLIELPSLGPRAPSLSTYLAPFENLVCWVRGRLNGRNAMSATAVDEEGRDYTTLYLQTLGRAAGQPVLMMSPDQLPEGWRQMD
jgi:protease-4